MSPELFPCTLTDDTLAAAKQGIKMAVEAWGERSLSVLEAEDRLSIACEKGASEDAVTLALRKAFQVGKGGKGGGTILLSRWHSSCLSPDAVPPLYNHLSLMVYAS